MATEPSTVVLGESRARTGEAGSTRPHRAGLDLGRVVVWLLLCAGSVVMALPVVWMVSTSLKEPAQIFRFPPEWIPNPVRWQNYPDALTAMPFGRYVANTLIITCLNMIGVLLSASLAAYGFARLRFPGRDLLFWMLLSTLMLPQAVILIPRYIEFRTFGWIDTWKPLIVPNFFGSGIGNIASVFYIFLLRQFFRTIPRELTDAARIDGASEFRIYWQIVMPLSQPALAVVLIFTFLDNWNNFQEPLIFLSTPEKFTIALGLASFRGLFTTQWHLLMAATTVVILPVVVLFFLLQRYFVRGFVLTGIKG
ncbi:MAG TPA: carbohydrate ABC transporter permease [Thermomicrobiales bacterium]|jgi:ABC-type glycerol-3-phosphate transport system permease component